MTYLPRIHLKNSQHMSLAQQPWRVLLTVLALALVTTSCSNRNPAQSNPNNPANAAPDRGGDWFCQPAVAGADDPWECIQDKNLAANPKPDRLPDADDNDPINRPLGRPLNRPLNRPTIGPSNAPAGPQPPGPPIGVDAAERPEEVNEQLKEVDVTQPTEPALPPPPPAPGAPGVTLLPGSDPPGANQSVQTPSPSPPKQISAPVSAQSGALPDYIRLAFQPTEPVSILELPSSFYAVQLVALSTAEDVNRFINENQLKNLTAARVAIDNSLRYVLILGIYDSREKAEIAAADEKPAALASFTPWIRKLSNLQQAMLAAESNSEV